MQKGFGRGVSNTGWTDSVLVIASDELCQQ
jgi:hypothetical protein